MKEKTNYELTLIRMLVDISLCLNDIITGQKLMSDGHRVRLATHTCFRTYVEKQGLEFYPLAGDPHLLSDFMVKTNGCLIPTTADLLREVWYHAVKC